MSLPAMRPVVASRQEHEAAMKAALSFNWIFGPQANRNAIGNMVHQILRAAQRERIREKREFSDSYKSNWIISDVK